MEKINGFTIDPRNYQSWVGFAHDFCQGCIYERGSLGGEDRRVNECSACCRDVVDYHYYREKQPILVTKNEDGKNIVKLVD